MANDTLEAVDLLNVALSKDINLITRHDKLFFSSLLELVYHNDPLALRVCHSFTVLNVEGDQFLETIEAAYTQIEEVLDPHFYLKEALEIFDGLTPDQRSMSPLWFFLARSEFVKTKSFNNELAKAFGSDPSFYSEVIERTRDLSYLPVLEEFLTTHAALVRYLPMREDSHEVFPPHDIWLRVGSAYVRFLKLQSQAFSPISVLDFLSDKFCEGLPQNSDDWIKDLDDSERRKFLAFHNLYFLHYEVNSRA